MSADPKAILAALAGKSDPSSWDSWTLNLYVSRKGPDPLGTVDPLQIEALAKEKLKDYPGLSGGPSTT